MKKKILGITRRILLLAGIFAAQACWIGPGPGYYGYGHYHGYHGHWR